MTHAEADFARHRIQAALQALGTDAAVTVVPRTVAIGWCVEIRLGDRAEAMKLATELESASVVP